MKTIHKTYKCYHKDSKGKYVDVSHIVSGVELSAGLGFFSSVKLDLVYGEVSFDSDGVSVPAFLGHKDRIVLRRNDTVVVTESGPQDGVVKEWILLVGIVSDFTSAKSGSSYSATVYIESPLAKLESTSTLDMLSGNSSPFNAAPTIGVFNKPELKQRIKNVLKDLTNLTTTRGAFAKYNTKIDLVATYDDKTSLVWFRPWLLVRDVLVSCYSEYVEYFISINTKKSTEEDNTVGLTQEQISEMRTRVSETTSLLLSVEDQYGGRSGATNILLPFSDQLGGGATGGIKVDYTNEFVPLFEELIESFLGMSGRSSSIWGAALSKMRVFLADFSPNIMMPQSILSSRYIPLGSFIPLHPYKEPSAFVQDAHIESMSPVLTNHNGLVRAVSYSYVPSSSTNIPAEDRPIWDTLAKILIKFPGDNEWVLNLPSDDRNLELVGIYPQKPELGANMEIDLPGWISQGITNAATEFYGNSELSYNEKYKQEKIDRIAFTANNYLSSAWMYFGRKNVKASIGLIKSFPQLRPGNVLKFQVGSNMFTALVDQVSIVWDQGSAYRVSINVTHCTSVKDPFYRALKTGLVVPGKDVLEITFVEGPAGLENYGL